MTAELDFLKAQTHVGEYAQFVTRKTTDKQETANFKENLPADYAWVAPSPELEAWFDSLVVRDFSKEQHNAAFKQMENAALQSTSNIVNSLNNIVNYTFPYVW